jgi:hypothetical protein
MMGHDEIRILNWDTACTSRHLSPADILGDNVTKCDSIIRKISSGAETFVWSDMFDSLHNAHNNYYLVNGDLTNDWLKIPTSVTIVNWNGGARDKSLKFFADHGFSQITSPYYDVRSTANMRDWRIAMENVQNIRGMMYTTWSQDYSFLRQFGDYSWGAGPMIMHVPIDSTTAAQNPSLITVEADIYPDSYHATDSIRTATVTSVNGQSVSETITLTRTAAHHFVGVLHSVPEKGYTITAVSADGLASTSPAYVVKASKPASVSQNGDGNPLRIYPNPATDRISIELQAAQGETWSVELLDLTGRVVKSVRGLSSAGVCTLSTDGVAAGSYECRIVEGGRVRTAKVSVMR